MAKKKQSARRRNQISWSLLALVFVVVLATVCIVAWIIALIFGGLQDTSKPANLPSVEKSVVAKKPNKQLRFNRTFEAYQKAHEGKPNLKWWMLTDDIQTQDRTLEERLLRECQHIEALLNKYREVSTETKKAYSRFNRVFPTIYTIISDSSVTMVTTGRWSKRPRDIKTPWKLTEGEFFCMFAPRANTGSKNAAMKDFFSSSTELKVVMLCCAVYPDPIYASGMYHELVHLSSNEPLLEGQEYNVQEEVLAHEVSAAVLNAALDGRYFPVIDRLVASYRASSWEQMTEEIRIKDLRKLDKVLGLENGGTDLNTMALGNHLITLGFRFIDQTGGKDKQKQKEDYYTWLRNQKY